MTEEKQEEIERDIQIKENLKDYLSDRDKSAKRFVIGAIIWISVLIIAGVVWVVFTK